MKARTILVAAAMAVLFVGCGGSDDSSDATTTTVADGGGTDSTAADASGDDGSDDGGSADPTDSEPAGPTAELPEDFPEDLTPPDDAEYQTALANEQDGKRDWFVVAALPGDVTEVADAIVAQLEAGDYSVTADEAGGIPGGAQSRTIQAEDDTYTVSISVDDAARAGGEDGTATASYTVTEI